MMHELIGLAGYLFSPLTLLLLGCAALLWPGAKWLALLAFVAAAGAAFGLAGLLDAEAPTVGAAQRLLETSVVGWIVACGLYLGLQKKTAAP